MHKLGIVVGWGMTRQTSTGQFESDKVQRNVMSVAKTINCLSNIEEVTFLPDGIYCAGYQYDGEIGCLSVIHYSVQDSGFF